MATASADDCRAELDDLGRRRREHQEEDKELGAAISKALKRARRLDIPVTEVSQRLGVHRTTLYRVYDAPH